MTTENKIFWKWIGLVITSILVELVGIFGMIPLTVLFTNKDGKSPWWGWPWLTWDNPIDGDAGHWVRHPANKTWWDRTWRRLCWLYRNRAYNYAYHKCGFDVTDVTVVEGTPFWQDNEAHGYCKAVTSDGHWMIFSYQPSFGKCNTRKYLGWKLRPKIDAPTVKYRAMICYHWNPFRTSM